MAYLFVTYFSIFYMTFLNDIVNNMSFTSCRQVTILWTTYNDIINDKLFTNCHQVNILCTALLFYPKAHLFKNVLNNVRTTDQ